MTSADWLVYVFGFCLGCWLQIRLRKAKMYIRTSSLWIVSSRTVCWILNRTGQYVWII